MYDDSTDRYGCLIVTCIVVLAAIIAVATYEPYKPKVKRQIKLPTSEEVGEDVGKASKGFAKGFIKGVIKGDKNEPAE